MNKNLTKDQVFLLSDIIDATNGHNTIKILCDVKKLITDFEIKIRQDEKEKCCHIVDKITIKEFDIMHAMKLIMEFD